MSSQSVGESHRQGIEKMWEALVGRDLDEVVQQHLLRWVDEDCKEQINTGDFDSAVALEDLYNRFHETFVGNSETTASGEEIDITRVFPSTLPDDTASKLLFQRIIQKMVERDVILYVYDKQRVRSRVAEVTRYFALLRQRFADESDFEQAPSLTKMVKMDIQSRGKPKWGEDGIDLREQIRNILSKRKTSDPAPELAAASDRDGWEDATKDSLKLLHRLCERLKLTGLAAFQGRAIDRLYRQAVTTDYDEKGHVVTASTGGGKTEAFLFPIIAYSLTTHHPNIRLGGVDAVLAYPRKDLCDNQFQRIVEYLYKLERLIEAGDDGPFDSLPITVALQHSGSSNTEIDCPVEDCEGRMKTDDMECDMDPAHSVSFAKTGTGATADIVVITPDSLHRRLMDHHGQKIFWRHDSPPKFVVLDEVHIYTSQYGMHIANVMRRFRSALYEKNEDQHPCFVASSATISNAEQFTRKIFGVPEATEITPAPDEIEEIGWEYLIFIKATDPRQVLVPQGEAKYLPRSEWDEDDARETNVTNLSSMIQVAFAMYHTILKKNPDDGEVKNKILGFVDSIDSVKRLGDYIQDAESGRGGAEGEQLFKLRTPDAFLRGEGERGTNPDCPKHKFRSNAADHERAVCEPLPPNKHLNPCPVYEAGECWWTMTEDLDLQRMNVYLHKSGQTETPDGTGVYDDDWDLMVTTSALEVGFDHPGIIGTFQYRAPMNIPGFVQRKGRGGREPEDQPISVVVLGSQPEDAFYFHHENLLSDPDDRYLRINLDEENEFVRIEHMVSAIFDYFNLTDPKTGEDIYRLNIEKLDDRLTFEKAQIQKWLRRTYETVDEELVDQVYDSIVSYVRQLEAPVVPASIDSELQSFWEAARLPRGMKTTELETRLDDLKYKQRRLDELVDDQKS